MFVLWRPNPSIVTTVTRLCYICVCETEFLFYKYLAILNLAIDRLNFLQLFNSLQQEERVVT